MGAYPLLPDETCWFLAANFDKQITRTRTAALVLPPFRLSERVPDPTDDAALFAFVERYTEAYRGYVREAARLADGA